MPHTYLPDYVSTLVNDGVFIAEAGRATEKARGQAVAKAETARRVAHLYGGVFWLGTAETLSRRRHHNLVFLHTRRAAFPTFAEIAPAIMAVWQTGGAVCVSELVAALGRRWSGDEGEAAPP